MKTKLILALLMGGLASCLAQVNLSIQQNTPTNVTVTLTGCVPMQAYALLGKVQLTDTNWVPIAVATADANASTSFTVGINNSGSGFFISTIQNTDTDGDGIPDWWMLQYFGHATGLASDNSRAQDSAANDGVSNLTKYLRGADPRLTPTQDNTNLVQLKVFTPSN